MWRSLELTNFKSFKRDTIPFGPFTVIVGTNASGKSNIRDAFRFLHGIGRDYSLAEIIGAKYGDGGELVWRGIRGGAKELEFNNADWFSLKGQLGDPIHNESNLNKIVSWEYGLACQKDPKDHATHTVHTESLSYETNTKMVFNTRDFSASSSLFDNAKLNSSFQILASVDKPDSISWFQNDKFGARTFLNSAPIFCQIDPSNDLTLDGQEIFFRARHSLSSMRFLDLVPDKMRQPSFVGQTVLGDQGENLSSVLFAICEDPKRKEALLEWVRELTPMDAVDFEFPPDQIGRVLLTLVEKDGRRISAYSASDGTLRFLAIAAALLGPSPAKLYFLEELDNGIHPTRLHLLIQLIERAVSGGKTQVIATTHSPSLLGLLSEESLEDALLVYRLPGQPDSRTTRIVNLPNAHELIREQSAGRLHASGWLEDAVAFTAEGVQ
jgi:predicted ATPase